MADKSAYVPVDAAGGSAPSGKARPAELDIDIDDNDYFGGGKSATSAPPPPAAAPPPPPPAPTPAPAPAPAASSGGKKHVYQKPKSYQKTYAGQSKK